MELTDYAAALRRHWRTAVATLMACLAVAAAALVLIPPTYAATAAVFASASPSIPNSAQYVLQRAQTYPSVAESSTVLAPVITRLGLSESVAEVRAQVTATNPADTSQVTITATGPDPREAATLADAVAEELVQALPDLEKHAAGDVPIQLTITDRATVPSVPVSPVPSLLWALGAAAGLALGAAAAIVHSRLDTRVYTEDHVRSAWGAGANQLVVHTAPTRRRRRRPLAGRPATLLAHQLEPLAEDRRLRVLVLSPSGDERAARSLVDELAAALPPCDQGATAGRETGVELAVGKPLAPPREWRRLAQQQGGVVLVVEPGRVDRTDLRDMRSILDAAGVGVLGVVLPARRSRRVASGPAPAPGPVQDVRPAGAPGSRPVRGSTVSAGR